MVALTAVLMRCGGVPATRAVLQQADPTYVDLEKSALRLVPSDPRRLSEYDVYVLADFDPQLISQSAQQAIYDAVTTAGAGCMFVSGAGSPAARSDGCCR